MSDKYNSKDIEDKYYDIWEKRNYFDAKQNSGSGKYFSIMMPPPNVTGKLHIGHALTFTLQDIIVRYKRMDGYETLWQAGLDHAGIATQNVVEKQLLEKGTTKEELGRDEFLKKVWEWKEYSGGSIVYQMRKLGVTPAWQRSRFTMDDGLKESVKQAFVSLYDKKMIIRGNYMVNWCTHDGALSDIEVEHSDVDGKLYHIKYFLKDSKEYVVIATTRPETYFGDSALMVHPDDDRHKNIIGKEVLLPMSDRVVKVIADDYVDKEFGTGVVKVTPAHDQNDYEVGKRHNLEFISIFDEKGILNDYAGDFKGLDRLKAREPIVKKLQELGYIEKIDEHKHQVGHCYRCKNIVEPFISKQWFVKKEVAKSSIEKVNKKLVKFFPPHWINSYNAWMDNLRDWCISRQLWWGHRIPVFYCDDCDGEFASLEDNPKHCKHCKSINIHQDPDVLDTWFSSSLWPFSTLGWGQSQSELFDKDDLGKFYPNSLLITGFDILFFWVARMMIMGEQFLDKLPFKDIYLHALVRDEYGNKMSKSKGNVIDPLDMVEEFNADIVRFSLAYLAIQGRDIKLGHKHLMLYRNFTNKLFNASKYLLLNKDKFPDIKDIQIKTQLGLYMQSRLNRAVLEIRNSLDVYNFHDSASIIYRFAWGEFCDIGIELSKAEPDAIVELGAIFKETLKLINPFMPFISEHLYQNLNNTTLEQSVSIMEQDYPTDTQVNEQAEELFSAINDAITSIRRLKATINVSNFDKVYLRFYKKIDEIEATKYIKKLAKVNEIIFINEPIEDSFSDVSDFVQVYIKSSDFDITPIINKLNTQKEKLHKIEQKISSMLNNKNFVANAPQDVLDKNKDILKDTLEKLENINQELKRLS